MAEIEAASDDAIASWHKHGLNGTEYGRDQFIGSLIARIRQEQARGLRFELASTSADVVRDQYKQRAEAAEAERDQWATRAAAMVDAEIRQQSEAQSVAQEREQLAAQVAALVEYTEHESYCQSWMIDFEGHRCLMQPGRCSCGLTKIEANLPAAAARYLAADKACQAIQAQCEQRKPGDYGVCFDVLAELDEYRKAVQG